MADAVSKEVFFLRQVAGQQFSKDFVQNLTQVNNTLSAVGKYLISMQQGIDDLNRDIIEIIQDFIDEVIIIFFGGGSSGFEWGDLHYIFQAIGRFFGLGTGGTPSYPPGTAIPQPNLAATVWNNMSTQVNSFFSNIVGQIAQAFTGVFGNLAAITGWKNGVTGDLGNLQSRTQVLEGVIGYCHTWCSGGVSLAAGDRFIPMDNRIGPLVGTAHAYDRIYLGTKGLWVADAHLTFDFLNIGVTYINLQLVVKNASGTVWFNRFAEADTDKRQTLSVHMAFTVPGTGYYLEVIANAGSGRGIKGGSQWNGLSVNKMSTETS